jgi:hypothetical protein
MIIPRLIRAVFQRQCMPAHGEFDVRRRRQPFQPQQRASMT